MQHRKLGYVLFALAAAGGCTVNGKPLFQLGASAPAPAVNGGNSGSAGPATTAPAGPAVAQAGPAPSSLAWCRGLRKDDSLRGATDLRDALDPAAGPGRAVPVLLQALCYPSADARGKQGALAAALRTWMQRLLADERDLAADVVPWANLPYGDRMAALSHTPSHGEGVAPSEAGPIQQWAMLRGLTGPSDAFRLQPGAFYYLADAFAPTEAGRLGFIERCLLASGARGDVHPAQWAVCQPDLDALDLGRLAAELRAEAARPLVDRIALRLAASEVQRHLPAHAAKVAQLTGRDPAYAELFELARTAREQWTAGAAARADLLAAVRAMDDARATGSRRALEGCAARIWPLFTRAVGKLPAKRFENLRGDASRAQTFFDAAIGAILQDPDAYLAANALLACEGPTDHLRSALRAGLSYWSGFRGPRTAALTAIRLAGLVPDRRGETIEVPAIRLPLAIDRTPPAWDPTRGTAIGVIATVTDRGATVRVTFPATSEVQEQCASRRTTQRISRIDASGNVHYESVCTRWQRVRVDTTLAPVDVPKRYAAGLAPRRHVSIIAGVPEAVWARPNSPTPLAAFGALLK
ncbi:MAG TPA: hypothetical protein VK932_28165 [Kofleriaceae bacterium]|nr:hypothetical protein [Kofleriaceae bacterium]